MLSAFYGFMTIVGMGDFRIAAFVTARYDKRLVCADADTLSFRSRREERPRLCLNYQPS